MVKIQVSLRIDKDFWDSLPSDNRSKWVRGVLDDYVNGDLVKDSDVKAIERENRLLHLEVDDLKTDKVFLQNQITALLPQIESVSSKRWYQFWK